MTQFDRIGLGWQVGVPSGWGMYGLNLASQLAARGIEPGLFFGVETARLSGPQKTALAGPLSKIADYQMTLKSGALPYDGPVLKALSDDLGVPDVLDHIAGAPDIGVVFFESGVIPKAAVATAQDKFASIITGSTWNTEVLQDHGFSPVFFCPQGVDTAVFHPRPKTGRFKDRFVVFSGGKFEYRKGQDLVVAAFKMFQARHPEALLVTAWHNLWPPSVETMALSAHIEGLPQYTSQRRLDIGSWLAANGVPEEAHLDAGVLSHEETAELFAETDVAVFPNRCEGGTNLVAMEAMACGVPVILSQNTGHLDLIADDRCVPLTFQIPLGEMANRPQWTGWGESSIAEIDAALERVFSSPDQAKDLGGRAADFMSDWTWSRQTDRLLAAISKTV